jgi:hypothetical protein
VANMRLKRSNRERPADANISRSEKIATSLAAALLAVGLTTGVFVKSVNVSAHELSLSGHAQTPEVQNRG